MARRQSFAVLVKSQADEEAGVLCIRSRCPIDSVFSKNRLDLISEWLVDNCRMLSGIGIPFVRDLTAIDAVLEHEIEDTAGQFLAAIRGAVRQSPLLTPDSCTIKFGL